MIDLHCHVLPEIDDGSKSFAESVAMCRLAAADGITHLVATPHSNAQYAFHLEKNQAKVAELQAAVGETPRILLGCDFHLSYENIQQVTGHRSRFTINQHNYLLLECDEFIIPRGLRQVFFELLSAGIIPLISHPERNRALQGKPELIFDWVRAGCLIQVTAQSLTGHFGKEARHYAWRLLRHRLVHCVATDAHDLESRPPVLSPAYRQVALREGQPVAERLFRQNPQAIIDGQDVQIPWEPLPFKKAKRFWLF